MSETVTEKNSSLRKQPYVSPKLIVYGDIKTLTTGGYSSVQEVAIQNPNGSLP